MRSSKLFRSAVLRSLRRSAPLELALALVTLAGCCLQAPAQAYKVTNIVSDGSVAAQTTDASFINPWAISTSGTWWISAQGSGFNYVVPATGAISFKVIVPAASGSSTATGSPTGSVTTGGSTGMILPNGTKASFLFSTLDGTISGWNSKLGTANAVSQVVINNSAAGASYHGLAILNTSAASYVLAPNFGSGNSVEVYDSNFKPTKLAGSFVDPNLPANYAPVAIHIIGTQIFVVYGLRTSSVPYDTVDGLGNGLVDIFDTTGTFVSRAVTGGNLNSPWGVAYAPANFGIFSNALLIGNEGDGIINAYDSKSFAYLGQLMDSSGKSLVYEGLWELLTGGTAVAGTTAVSGGDTSTVYFTAGLHNEAHGLFAGITSSSITGATPSFGFSAGAGATSVTAGSSVDVPLSIAPVNGFSGTVSLTCSGLPAGTTCNFSPAQFSASATAVTNGTVTIKTSKASAGLRHSGGNVAVAGFIPLLLLPVSLLLLYRLRSAAASLFGLARVLFLLIATASLATIMLGCGNNNSQIKPSTPTGQSTLVITASSGNVSQQTSINLTVQ